MGSLSSFFQLGPIPNDAMNGYYDFSLVVLSYLVAALASYIALGVSQDIRKNPTQSVMLRVLGGAFAMGAGIFSMHFIGMLAFILPMQMDYNLLGTLGSLLVAFVASGLAIYLVKEPTISSARYFLGGTILGITISSMHYTGMAAMENVTIRYLPGLFSLSVLIGIVASLAALWLMLQCDKRDRDGYKFKVASALVMGLAVVGMHYTGMAAAVISPGPMTHTMNSLLQMTPGKLSFLIAFVASSIMIVALIVTGYRHLVLVKLLMGYLVIILLIVPLSFFFSENLKTINPFLSRVIESSFPKIRTLTEMKSAIHHIEMLMSDPTSSAQEWQENKVMILQSLDELENLQTQYQQFVVNESSHERASELIPALTFNQLKEVIRHVEYSDTAEARAGTTFAKRNPEFGRNIAMLSFAIQETITRELDNLKKLQQTTQQFVEESYTISLVAIAVIILFSVAVSMFLAFQISKPIRQFQKVSAEIAKGNLNTKVDVQSNDEFGQLANSFNAMVDALALSTKQKDGFLAMAAHDLRNPVSAIKEGTSLLSSQLEGRQKKMVDMMNRSSESMLVLIEELLVVNAIRSDSARSMKKPVQLDQFFKNIVELNQLLASKKNMQLNLEANMRSEVAYFDESKIEQVIINFISNAIKFSKPGSLITLKVNEDGKKLRVAVEDEAGGIPEGEHPKVFSRFCRISVKPTGGESSHGLGLAICKEIVESLGGTIGFSSISGKGCTFFFEIDDIDSEGVQPQKNLAVG